MAVETLGSLVLKGEKKVVDFSSLGIQTLFYPYAIKELVVKNKTDVQAKWGCSGYNAIQEHARGLHLRCYTVKKRKGFSLTQ